MTENPVESTEHPVPVTVPEITSVEELDTALGALTDIDAQLGRIEATRAREINRAHAKANQRRAPLGSTRDAWVAAIARYCDSRKPYLRRRFGRTIRLSHGVIEWRWSPLALDVEAESIQDAKQRDAALRELIGLIRKLKGWRKYIRIKYELDKDALKKHPRITNRIPGLRRTQHEDLRIKPNKVRSALVNEGRTIVVRGKARKN